MAGWSFREAQPLREFLRNEPLLQGGRGARVRLDLETNTLFLVLFAEHVDVLANAGEHTFLAVGTTSSTSVIVSRKKVTRPE
jgi:hypothetical protein